MIIDSEKIQKIREAIQKHFNVLIFKVAGGEYLTKEQIDYLINEGLISPAEEGLIKESYYIGRAMNFLDPRQRTVRTWSQFHKEYRNKGQPISDREKYAIDHIVQSSTNNLKRLQETTKALVENILLTANLEYRHDLLGDQGINTLVYDLAQRKTINQIASDLRDVTGDLYRDWKRVALTEITNGMNLGESDAIVERNKGKRTNEIYVYKRVNRDSATCTKCIEFYTIDGTVPKVYRLSDLAANGTNFGLKQSEWRPIIGSTHPNCRCSLLELKDGWGFDSSGSITYEGPNFIYYRDKQGNE